MKDLIKKYREAGLKVEIIKGGKYNGRYNLDGWALPKDFAKQIMENILSNRERKVKKRLSNGK